MAFYHEKEAIIHFKNMLLSNKSTCIALDIYICTHIYIFYYIYVIFYIIKKYNKLNCWYSSDVFWTWIFSLGSYSSETKYHLTTVFLVKPLRS